MPCGNTLSVAELFALCRQLKIHILLAERKFREFTCRGHRQLWNELNIVRNPPPSNLALEPDKQLLFVHGLVWPQHGDQQWALVSLVAGDANGRSHRHRRMQCGDVLQFD